MEKQKLLELILFLNPKGISKKKIEKYFKKFGIDINVENEIKKLNEHYKKNSYLKIYEFNGKYYLSAKEEFLRIFYKEYNYLFKKEYSYFVLLLVKKGKLKLSEANEYIENKKIIDDLKRLGLIIIKNKTIYPTKKLYKFIIIQK